MANLNGKNYTSFQNIQLKGSSGNVGALRTDQEDGYDINLPKKSGTFPIMGTFAIQLPALAATTFVQSTIATVSGIRAEDGLVVTLQGGVSAGYGTATTARVLQSAIPGNGNITLNFVNIGAGTGYVELLASYVAVR